MYRFTFLASLMALMLITSLSGQNKYSNEEPSSGVSEEVISSEELRKKALNIFLDCPWCDKNYIKQVIPFVNYVTNKDEADVHVFVRRQVNGGGGGDYTIDFIGHGDFDEINDQLKFISPIDETADETREARSGMIAMGLMKYVARTPVGRNIKISYLNKEVPERILNPTIKDDPWDSWMFRLRGSGSFSKDENYQSTRANTTFSADRVTPYLKIEFDARYDHRQTKYTSDELEDSFRKNWSLRGMVAKSIGTNWAAGGRFSTSGDSYNNYDLSTSLGPALEYNFFPYEESFKHQVRVQYGLSGILNDYKDTTYYMKTEEALLKHYLSMAAGFNQPWGSGYFSVTGSNYLHNFSLNNLGIRGSINYRIYKGLSVNLDTRANLIHDQINLPKEDASEQDVLTKQIALQTGYYYSLEFGLSYSFGSIYNNVVNTRFGN